MTDHQEHEVEFEADSGVATPCGHLRGRACHWCGQPIELLGRGPAAYWVHSRTRDATCSSR